MKKRKSKNGYIFWNVLAGSLLAILFIIRFWIVDMRVEYGFFTAPSWVINVDYITGGLVNALLIGWIAGNLLAKAKK